jgi:hypothetical protein
MELRDLFHAITGELDIPTCLTPSHFDFSRFQRRIVSWL